MDARRFKVMIAGWLDDNNGRLRAYRTDGVKRLINCGINDLLAGSVFEEALSARRIMKRVSHASTKPATKAAVPFVELGLQRCRRGTH